MNDPTFDFTTLKEEEQEENSHEDLIDKVMNYPSWDIEI